MKLIRPHLWGITTGAALLASACAPVPNGRIEPAAGFVSMFDGTSLSGWQGDPAIWSVRDGAITGGSDAPLTANTFLIYQQPYSNFELHYRYRMSGDGNSGVQFRSVVTDPAKYVVQGYQANVVPTDQAERFGMLWEEGGRAELALLGHKIVLSRKDNKLVKNVLSSTNPRSLLYGIVRPYPQWNDVVVVAYGNHMVHALNGHVVFDVVDEDPVGRKDGVIALQAHSGPPMHVQFKDVEIKNLTAPPSLDGRFITNPGPPTPAEPGPRVPRE